MVIEVSLLLYSKLIIYFSKVNSAIRLHTTYGIRTVQIFGCWSTMGRICWASSWSLWAYLVDKFTLHKHLVCSRGTLHELWRKVFEISSIRMMSNDVPKLIYFCVRFEEHICNNGFCSFYQPQIGFFIISVS